MTLTIASVLTVSAVIAAYKVYSFCSGIGSDALNKDLPDSWTVDTTADSVEDVAEPNNEKVFLSIVSSVE